MDQQLISIIVAAYNVEKYLDRCIKSLVMQTYPHLEIILVDDGSTDKTGLICDGWAHRDSRIRVIHKKNGGVSDARNTGIRNAQGKWLGFVDADDYISPTMYERLYQHRTEKGMTVCGFLIEKDGNLQHCPGIEGTLNPREAVDLYIANELYSGVHGVFTYWGSYPWNKLYDRVLFNRISYPVGKKYEDIYIILALVKQAKSIRFIHSCEYVYIQHPNSITHDVSNIVHDSLQARLLQKEQLSKYWKITDSRINKILSSEYFHILYRYACLSPGTRKKQQETAENAWQMVQKLGYDFFPVKMKVKLFMYVYCPSLQYVLRIIKLKIKG